MQHYTTGIVVNVFENLDFKNNYIPLGLGPYK
jgi:hypothetical protein